MIELEQIKGYFPEIYGQGVYSADDTRLPLFITLYSEGDIY